MKKILGTLLLLISGVALADTRFKFSETVPLMTGNAEYTALEIGLTNSNHTGSGNKLYGIRFPDMTLDAQALGTAIDLGQGWHYGIHLTTNLPILFGPVNGGTQIYYDGSILSVSDKMTVYGDVLLNDKALRDFDKLAIKQEDLNSGACDQDQTRIDVGGATVERCYCVNSAWYCTPLRPGPMD